MSHLAVLAQVTLPHVSGLPRDAVANSFAVITDPTWVGDNTDLGEVTIPIANFYAATATGNTTKVGQYIGTQISRATSACRIKCYDVTSHLDGSAHGSPFNEDGFTMPAATGSSDLPSEVAAVIRLRTANYSLIPAEGADNAAASFGGLSDPDSAPDRPRQRHTGRIYLGPLRNHTFSPNGNNEPILDATMRPILCRAIVALDTALGVNGHKLAIWSRKDSSFYEAGVVQVDDAPDTQRRRGMSPTATSTLTF